MTVVSNIVGGTTPTTAVVVTRVDSVSDVRVGVSTSPSLDDLAWFGPVTPSEPITGHFVAKIELTGLDPGSHYWWVSEHGGVQDTQFPGELDTLPVTGEPASYTVAVVGDAGLTPDHPGIGGVRFPERIANPPVCDTIRQHPSRPIMVCHLGDLHYYNPGSSIYAGSELSDYLGAYDDLLLQDHHHELFRTVPFQYMWDDHDYGNNDSDGTAEGKGNAAAAYRLRAPHHVLARSEGAIYHAFEIGRVLYVSSDTRYERTPNAAPDGPNKTYLGAAQKVWFRELLESTDAQALVWLNPNPWLGGHADTWESFGVERDELAAMFTDTLVPASGGSRTWAESMVCVAADVHALAMWSGSANPYGGFPGMLCASLDATPSAASGSQYDLGFRPGRGQYGTVTIDDDGDRITLTLTGWAGSAVWASQQLTVDAPSGPGPGPGPTPLPPAPVAVGGARIETGVSWLAVADATGRVIADLPTMRGTTSRLLMAYTSAKLTYPLGPLPIEVVEAATVPQQTSIVQVVSGVPVWSGRVLVREGGSGPDLTLGAVTPEQYLLGRHVTTRDFSGADRAEVAVALLADAGTTGLGQGMALEIDAELTGDLVDRRYLDTDQTTVYAALRELAEAGTLEWTIDLDWTDTTETAVRRIIRLRRRIGQQPVHPVVFESGTPAGLSYSFTEDFSSGRYANVVTAYGDGEGESMPRSDPAVDTLALASGAPIVEATVHVRDAADTTELNAVATAELARLMRGVELWELNTGLNHYPRLGYDIGIGDWARWDVKGPRHPHGVTGQGRTIGWDLDAERSRWTPKLLDPHEEVAL